MSLFSKMKDYNIELEDILDQKYFSSNLKNLFLSLIYKIEITYPDFKSVKRCVRSQEDFLNEIIETVRLYCDNMKSVEPDSEEAKLLIKNNVKALTNEKERSILVYPTELALLYAVSDVSPKYFYINNDVINRVAIQNTLVNGYIQNNLEILSDFTGWSWDKTYEKNYPYIDNLIYQNLLMMFGEKFLYEWRTYGSTRRDFINEAKNFIKLYTNSDKFFKLLNKICYLNLNQDDKKLIDKDIKEKEKQLAKMQNQEEYFAELKQEKAKIYKKIKQIEIVINDQKLLEKQFNKTNSKLEFSKKFISQKSYKEFLQSEKINYLRKMDEVDYYLKPSNFAHEKKVLEKIVAFYSAEDNLADLTLALEKEFLHFISKKLEKINTRDELIDIMFEMRYYRTLKLNKDIQISDIEILENSVDKIFKQIITKLCKIGALKIISMDINLNFEIIKYAIDNRIINLEQIKLEFVKEDKGLIIRIYDKDVYEKQGLKKIDVEKNTLEVRMNRKIKLFN